MLEKHLRGPHGGHASFTTPYGADENFILLESKGEAFPFTLENLHGEYESVLDSLGLSHSTAAFTRLYCSDIFNQEQALTASALYRDLSQGALSLVEQRPASKSRLSLFSYHVNARTGNLRREQQGNSQVTGRKNLCITGNHYAMHWLAGLHGKPGGLDAEAQSDGLWASATSAMDGPHLSWSADALRNWIFVRDIDNHYEGMVRSRRNFFESVGLNAETRFLASTGIEGRFGRCDSLVGMDLLGIKGLQPDQIRKMEALDHLSPTLKYGVTFERGLRVDFGDRSHMHISGTASIDKDGVLLHPGDVERQTKRTVENIEALLTAQESSLRDLAYVLVYVRDPASFQSVRETLRALLPRDLPALYLEAAVCRPGWLVEIEGVAVKPGRFPFPPFL